MKRIIFTFTILLSMSAALFADGLTATLQQGDVMTPFYGVDAFKQAYESAEDGAVITLSPGTFNNIISIEKEINLIGNNAFGGYFEIPYIDNTFLESIQINANNVKIEGIHFNGNVTLGNADNFHLKRCWVKNTLGSNDSHTNTLIDQCCISKDEAVANGINYTIKNSTIGCFSKRNTTNNIAYITNTHVEAWYHSWASTASPAQAYIPYAIYKNCILCVHNARKSSNTTVTISPPSEFYNNLFVRRADGNYDEYYVVISIGNCVISGNKNYPHTGSSGHSYSGYFNELIKVTFQTLDFSIIGGDGTPVGTTGGTGFNMYPSIPRITSKTIDSNTDSDGKINVKIVIKAEE